MKLARTRPLIWLPVLLPLLAGAAAPAVQDGVKPDPGALARAAAGTRAFAAHAKAHPSALMLMVGEPRRFAITHKLHAEIDHGKAGQWLFMEGWPPAGDGLKLLVPPAGEGLKRETFDHGAFWGVATLAAGAATRQSADWSCRFEVALLARHLGCRAEGARPAAPLATAEAARFLASTPACDWVSPEFQAWLDRTKLRSRGAESELTFARRVMRELWVNRIWRDDPWLPVQLSKVPTDGPLCCWETAQLMVGALRAAGIPARTCTGFFTTVPAGYTDPQQKNAHTRVEFFANGIGWVPADPTLPVTKLAPAAHERLLRGRIGFDDGTFVVMHHDLGLAWCKGQAQWTFRMLPGCYVKGEDEIGEVKFSQAWQARELKKK